MLIRHIKKKRGKTKVTTLKEVKLMNNKNNKALSQFKTEIATELGISNYDQVDKGQLTSRQNGYVGGNMTKKMLNKHWQLVKAPLSMVLFKLNT